LRCADAFFRARDEGSEARIAVKRFQVGVLLDAKVNVGRSSVVNSLAQERERLISASLARLHATQITNSKSRLRVLRAEHTTLNVEFLALHLLRLGAPKLRIIVGGTALFSGTQECHRTNTALRLGRSAAAAALCSVDYPVCQGPGTT
jgi:hypothetical protein